jgi:hypothetical protein
MKCPRCQADNRASARFCRQLGLPRGREPFRAGIDGFGPAAGDAREDGARD